MGKVFTKVFADISAQSAKILMLGLDGAGKTTILYTMKLDEEVTTVPTVGFNVESLTVCKGVTFTVWDVGGQEKTRRLWNLYFKGTHGLLFVVDSCDKERLYEAKEELHRMSKCDELRAVPLIVMANKQDRADALTPSQIADVLCLGQFKDRYWHVQGSCAVKGTGLVEAMTSLVSQMKDTKKRPRNKRRLSLHG